MTRSEGVDIVLSLSFSLNEKIVTLLSQHNNTSLLCKCKCVVHLKMSCIRT